MPKRASLGLDAPLLPFIDIPGISRDGEGISSKEIVRSFRRLAAILGLGLAAAGVYYSASYVYRKYYISRYPHVEKKLLSGQFAAASEVLGGPGPQPPQPVESPEEAYVPVQEQVAEVILHQCPRGFRSPCVSPFPLKLETFLRVADIPYKVDPSGSVTFGEEAKNGEKPWLTIDGTDIVDSHNCISELCKIFGIDLEAQAAPPRQTACDLLESHLDYKVYWAIALWRWVFEEGKSIPLIQPIDKKSLKLIPQITEHIRQKSRHHGYGRHTPERIADLSKRLIYNLAHTLGKHDYFLGASPGIVDCAAFALLTQMVFNMPGSPFEKEIQKYPNLIKYVERVKKNYWEDWDEILEKKDTTTAISMEAPSETDLAAEKRESNAFLGDSIPEPNANEPEANYISDEEPQQQYAEDSLPPQLEARASCESTASNASHGLDYSKNVVNQDQLLRDNYERHERYIQQILVIEAKYQRGERLTAEEGNLYRDYLWKAEERRRQQKPSHLLGFQDPAFAGYAYSGRPNRYYRDNYQPPQTILHETDYQPRPGLERLQQPLPRPQPYGYPTNMTLTDERDRDYYRHGHFGQASRVQVHQISSHPSTILRRAKTAPSPAPAF